MGVPGKACDERAVGGRVRCSVGVAGAPRIGFRCFATARPASGAGGPCQGSIGPGPRGRERRDAAPNRGRLGENFGLPKIEERVPRRGDNFNASPFDGLPVMSDFSGVPNQAKPPTMPERPTKGAEIGARLRARTNQLADTARESARLRGMPLIYGHGSGHQVQAPGR